MSTRRLLRCAWATGGLVALCIALLAVDWVIAARRAPRDDRLIKSLQQQVKNDAAFAPKLDAEHKRITDRRRERKQRDHIAGYVLIAAAAAFLASGKRLIKLRGRQTVTMRTLVAAPPVKKKRKRRRESAAAPEPAGTGIDLRFVDEMVARLGRNKETSIPLLQAIQQHYRYLPDEALRRVCELTEITPAEIAGTSSFYGQFRRSPVGKHIVRVCHGTACHVAGARQVTEELRRHLKLAEGADTDADRMFTLEEVACLGCCSLAPVLMVDEHTAGRLTPSGASAALDAVEQKEPA